MKKLLLALSSFICINVSAQSYIIMDNGVVLTMDRSSFIYDLSHDAYPQKVTLKGGKFFVEDNSVIATVDENGYLFRKYEFIPENIIGKGINYFLSGQGELYTVDTKGVVHIIEDQELKSAAHFGGNYFITLIDEEGQFGDLYTISKDGVLTKKVEALKVADIVSYGGSYFMNNRGIVHTIDADGNLSQKVDMRVGVIQKKGGNFFTDSSGMIFTVAQDGSLKIPAIPVGLKANSILKLGSNYFLDLSARLYVVDQDGNIFERFSRDHDFKNARVISL